VWSGSIGGIIDIIKLPFIVSIMAFRLLAKQLYQQQQHPSTQQALGRLFRLR
jgi:hypothetical protein